MASGLPVIATEVGGLPEVVEHGRTGLLVPSRNAAALADALSLLLSDEKIRAAFGREGAKRAMHCYSKTRMVREYEQIFERLLNTRRISIQAATG